MFKKIIGVILVVALAAGLLAACGDSSQPPAATTAATTAAATTAAATTAAEAEAVEAEDEAEATTAAAAATTAAATTAAATTADNAASGGIDTSKDVSLTMYILGDEPSDLAVVYEEFNKLLKEKINATLKTNYLSWGDWRDRYSLILAAGEDVDLMYTSDWAYYSTEAAKGAFLELKPDFLNTYMPMTMQSQNPAAIMQATLDGKLFAMPKNEAGLEGENWICIRKDLREKYGMDEIKSKEALEAYFIAVLENESGIFPHHASADGGFLNTMYSQPNKLFFIANTDISFSYSGTDAAPAASEFSYMWFNENLMPYFEQMKRWGDLGFWSANAINNPDQVRNSFENGKSASLTWNTTIFAAGKNLRENNPEWDFEAIDVNPGTTRRQAYFTNDAIAIAAASRNPERAAMFIDYVKNDMDVYLALVGGIHGKHYILNADGTRSAGPDASKYPWNPSTWCFNIYPPVRDADIMPEETLFVTEQEKMIKTPESMAFRFNVEPVKSEMAAIDALRDEYRPILQLGMASDIASTWAEWKGKAEAAGLERMMDEFRSQYNAWLAIR